MIKETLKLDGMMRAILTKADGTTEKFTKHNLIVDDGVDLICDCLSKGTDRPAVADYIAVGTDDTAVTADDTALGSELTRLQATYGHAAGTASFTLTATFNAGVATGAIVEAGVINASSGGSMLDRVVFPVINKEANDVLTVTFTFTLTI